MMEGKKVKKSKHLETAEQPTFNLGLTPSDEEKGNPSSSGGERKRKEEKHHKLHNDAEKRNASSSGGEAKGKQIKDDKKVSDKGKKDKDVDRKLRHKVSDKLKKDNDVDPRLRHKVSVPKVYDMMQLIEGKTRKDEIVKELTECGFGGMRYICNWTKIPTFFVDWMVKSFEKEHMWIRLTNTKVLPLRDDDVHRVYELPRVGKEIKLDLCSEGAIKRVKRELGLGGSSSTHVLVTALEDKLKTIDDPKAWVKGAICYMIHKVLCPTNHSGVSLQYAHILEDPAGVSSYNWCSYVLQHMKECMHNPFVANPLADFHFLMINYLEKMGKNSPFLTGRYKRPSLRDWDVKTALQDIHKVHDVIGLEHGLTAGVTTLYNTDEGPVVLCFDPDTCPLSVAPMHLNHCRGCIKAYKKAVDILEKRITEGKDRADVGKKKIRYKSSSNRGKRVPNVQDEEADDGQVPQRPLSGTQETILQYPEYFDAGFNKSGENVGPDEKAVPADYVEEQTVKQFPQYFHKGESLKTKVQPENADNEVPETSNQWGQKFDSDEDDEIDPKIFDDVVRKACNVGAISNPSQEIILSSPQISNVAEWGEASNAFDGGEACNAEKNEYSTQNTPSRNDPTVEEKDPEFFLHATPLRTVLVDEYIDLSQEGTVKPKRRKRKNEMEEDRTYPERRRLVKKSKYLKSPYDVDVYESTASKLHKDICTYAWSSTNEDEILYQSLSHGFSLHRKELWSLNNDEWVNCFVINSWANYLNWNQQNGQVTRLVTTYINHQYLERPEVDEPGAFRNFLEKLKWFKYMDWKKIDPTKLEYIMTPVLIGNPGSHYVCFVLNLKRHKFQFLNSYYGDKMESDPPNIYKKMSDVWLKEVKAFLIQLYTHNKMQLPFKFSQIIWESPRMPIQNDKSSCGVFCMKFIEQWQGHHNIEMDSFKQWSQLKKKEKKARVMDLRIEILCTILTDSSNSLRSKLQKNAISYCEELAQKL